MTKSYVLTGTVGDEHTVTLDEALPLTSSRVRLVVEPLRPAARKPYREVLAAIRQRQRARGYHPPKREEVDAYLREERESWG